MNIKKRILIVEDEAIVALDIKSKLLELSHTVVAINSSAEAAIECLTSKSVDLVLIDVTLKGRLSGIDLAREIASRHKIPFVFLTAHSDDIVINCCMDLKPYGFLRKPFLAKELEMIVELAFHRKKTESILLDIQNKYRQAITNSDIIKIAINEDGKITLVNQSFVKHCGYSKEEIIGKLVWDYLPPERISSARLRWARLHFEPMVPLETAWISKSGEQVQLFGQAEILHGQDGMRIFITVEKFDNIAAMNFISTHECLFEKLYSLLPGLSVSPF
ncbi:MAG: response regulator [Bacteroidetes bacterium]|nr:response regulator [Bacteroidota bacterium]MBU1720231.1 response regulator [Bacteroidota bacterium]